MNVNQPYNIVNENQNKKRTPVLKKTSVYLKIQQRYDENLADVKATAFFEIKRNETFS